MTLPVQFPMVSPSCAPSSNSGSGEAKAIFAQSMRFKSFDDHWKYVDVTTLEIQAQYHRSDTMSTACH